MLNRLTTSLLNTLYTYLAQMLRKLISSPRNRHNDELSSTSLDLAYLTPNLIVMSTPASSFPKNLWRNPVEDVRKFLDANHKDNWWVWSLRGEGSDYFDKDLEGKVSHSGWPDHHPPPFEYMGPILASIHKHLSSNPKATAVLHCKAGKGRSGTIAVSYLITYSNWDANKALQHFTIQRMRIGEGVSIASQRRWVRYVDLWANTLERTYKPRTVRICKIEFWGMRIMDQGDKIEVGIAGFQDGARVGSKEVDKIHVFEDDERTFESDKATYVPRKEIIVNADVNMFLTRHRLLHVSERIPKIPMSISHCWINTTLEKEKLRHGDTGYKEPVENVIEQQVGKETADEKEQSTMESLLPDEFKTKPNLDRKASEPNPNTPSISSTLSPASASVPTKRPNGPSPNGDLTSLGSSSSLSSTLSRSSKRGGKRGAERPKLKDLDWRGEEDGMLWWECLWEGMDGIGGTNKKGQRCFDRVRIWWVELDEEEVQHGEGTAEHKVE